MRLAVLTLLIGATSAFCLAQNKFSIVPTADKRSPVTDSDCHSDRLLSTYETDVWRVGDKSAFCFASGMTIDADGSPRAYNPDNTGLDDLKNARGEDGWVGILVKDGQPVVQGPNDPAPGYYVSKTALEDRTKRETDPARFVDSEQIPFIVLPGDVARRGGARVGDFAIVQNLRNGRTSSAIFADIGPGLGEGSIALARALRINPDARDGGTYRGVLFVVFPGSGNHRPRTVEEIESESRRLLDEAGGIDSFTRCVAAP